MPDDAMSLYEEWKAASDQLRSLRDQFMWVGDSTNKPIGSPPGGLTPEIAEEIRKVESLTDEKWQAFRAARKAEAEERGLR